MDKDIYIIGSGNVASVYAKLFKLKELPLKAIVSRNRADGQNIAKVCDVLYLPFSPNLHLQNAIVIIAVNDQSIFPVSNLINCDDSNIIIHTSGGTPISILDKHAYHGVMWPLQTIRKDITKSLTDCPITIHSNDAKVTAIIYQLASKLSNHIYHYDDEQRQYIHLSAVIANNFTNALIAKSYHLLKDHDVDVRILFPIIKETLKKLIQDPPDISQTGPAVRKDHNTIDRHIALLKDDDFAKIYKELSLFIQKQNGVG